MEAGLEGCCCLTKWHSFLLTASFMFVSPTLILARDGADSLAEEFFEIYQKNSPETHTPQSLEVMFLSGTGDKGRKRISLELA